jgi:hypothetical protein
MGKKTVHNPEPCLIGIGLNRYAVGFRTTFSS